MRLRLKLRWAMIAVAVAAVLCGPGYRYYGVLRDRADFYRGMAKVQETEARANLRRSRDMGWDEESRERSKKVAEWYLKRRDLYLRAASFPFITVEVEWEPWATVPYRYVEGTEFRRLDPALLWPRNAAERKRQGEFITGADHGRADEARQAEAAEAEVEAETDQEK